MVPAFKSHCETCANTPVYIWCPFSGHTIAYAHLCACFKQSKRPNACPSLKKASLYWNLKQCMEGAICPVCVKIAYSTCWEMAVVKLEPQLYHEGKHKVSSEATIFFLPIECCQIQPHSNTSSDEHPRLFFYHTSGQLQTVQQKIPCVAHRDLSGWPLSYR